MIFFFFKQKTAYEIRTRDWSSDVCSSDLSTAMTAIALFYTLGSVLGPIATGATVSYVSPHGLMISVGVAGGLFIALLMLRRAP